MPEAALLPLRAFLALPPDPGWSQSAAALADSLRPLCPPASWTRPSSWHLTLKFLGDAARDALDSFVRAIEPVAGAVPPFELCADGPVVFPDHGPARVLGIALGPEEALSGLDALVGAAEREARALGLAREARPWRPHVTLARIRSRWPAESVDRFRKAAKGWPFPLWSPRGCVLYSSRLEPAGAIHRPLAEWSFAGSGSMGGAPS